MAVVIPGVDFTLVLPSNSLCPTFRTSVTLIFFFKVRLYLKVRLITSVRIFGSLPTPNRMTTSVSVTHFNVTTGMTTSSIPVTCRMFLKTTASASVATTFFIMVRLNLKVFLKVVYSAPSRIEPNVNLKATATSMVNSVFTYGRPSFPCTQQVGLLTKELPFPTPHNRVSADLINESEVFRRVTIYT